MTSTRILFVCLTLFMTIQQFTGDAAPMHTSQGQSGILKLHNPYHRYRYRGAHTSGSFPAWDFPNVGQKKQNDNFEIKKQKQKQLSKLFWTFWPDSKHHWKMMIVWKFHKKTKIQNCVFLLKCCTERNP